MHVYVGGKEYGLVAPASKKICNAYTEEYGGQEERFTSYESAAASVNTARYCVENLCKTLEEKDEIFKIAAVNGNIDILRYATSSSYDLLPTLYAFANVVEEIVANGRLHVLQYMHEELGYQFRSIRFCRPAIRHGKLEILEWLNSINALDDRYLRYLTTNMWHIIISGKVNVIKWIQSLQHVNGKVFLKPKLDLDINSAIRSKSIDMIQYCLEMGKEFNDESEARVANTESLEVFRFCYENGLDYSEKSMREIITNLYYGMEYGIFGEVLEIIKFLRNIGVPWPEDDEDAAHLLFCYGSLEMVQYAYENGLTLPNYNDIVDTFIFESNRSAEILKYLIAIGTSWDSFLSNEFQLNQFHLSSFWEKKDLNLLDCFIGKNADLDKRILESILKPRVINYKRPLHITPYKIVQVGTNYEPVWLEGVQFMLEKGKDIEVFIEDVVHPYHHPNMILIKFLRTCQGCHWTRNDEDKIMQDCLQFGH